MLRVTLFGRFSLRRRREAVDGLVDRKAQQLLCYLLIFRRRPHSREVLVNNLWAEKNGSQSKKCLRQALWQLRSTLENQVDTTSDSLLLVDSEWIQINPQAAMWLDVAVFEQAFHLAKDIPGENLTDEAAETLSAAAKLYKGDLLEGWFDDWCLLERERQQSKYLAMLGKLMAHCRQNERYDTGLAHGESVLSLEPAHERAHRAMMNFYYLNGDRTLALRQYESCSATLKKELGVEPSTRTRRLYEQIRAGEPCQRPAAADTTRKSQPELGMLDVVLDELYQLQSQMDAMQHHIYQQIKVVESTLSSEQQQNNPQDP